MKVSYLAGMNISASGLLAQREVMNAAAENLANLHTTRTESGDPYRRKVATLASESIAVEPRGAEAAVGVRAELSEDASEFPTVHDPGHPDADENGMVRMPNVDLAQEMVTMMAAARAYEANIAALQSAKKVAEAGLNLAR